MAISMFLISFAVTPRIIDAWNNFSNEKMEAEAKALEEEQELINEYDSLIYRYDKLINKYDSLINEYEQIQEKTKKELLDAQEDQKTSTWRGN